MTVDAEPIRTPDDAESVYGADPTDLEDPAELYHEASAFYQSFHARQAPGWPPANPSLMTAFLRCVKRHEEVARVSLPAAGLPQRGLEDVFTARVSRRSFNGTPLTLPELASVLHAAYGVVDPAGERPETLHARRTVPSAGGLYPLELYVVAERVESLPRGLHHYDPKRHSLEELSRGSQLAVFASGLIDEDMIHGCSAIVLLSAMFWRSRFKYGLRGYRFALLEAGHVGQNILLAAAALGVGACPVGGFYDRTVNEALDLDGVNEAILYCVVLGDATEGS
jgi:SagB-type dehydrogenase family enzyme